jgi:hypothetical protein
MVPLEAETVTLVPFGARLPLASFTVTLMLDGLVQVTLAGEADTVTLLAVEKVVDVGNVG